MNYLKIIFPLIDHLYIFQLFEYQNQRFFNWYMKYPLKRNLQRKHSFEPTPKSLLILIISLSLILPVCFGSYLLFESYWVVILNGLICFYLSPLFLILANLILKPLDLYSRNKIITLAKQKRKELKDLVVVAIVGSFAKTSTKNILYTLLWKDFYVVKTPKSYNTELSVARSLIRDTKSTTQIFIAEMDAYYQGEIDKLCQIVRPNYGVITAIAAQHLERFSDMDQLANTQFEIAKHISNGFLFLNSNDEWSMKLKDAYDTNKVIYGKSTDEFYISQINQKESGLEFYLHQGQKKIAIKLPLQGEHNAYNFLAAASIAKRLGLNLEKIAKRASLVLPTEHRLEIKQYGNITLIDNSFNANATSYKSSFKLLREYPGKQKIIITPGLVEIGTDSGEIHQQLAIDATLAADQIIIVGENAREELLSGIRETKFSKDDLFLVETTNQALDLLKRIAKPQAVVLIENDLPDQYF